LEVDRSAHRLGEGAGEEIREFWKYGCRLVVGTCGIRRQAFEQRFRKTLILSLLGFLLLQFLSSSFRFSFQLLEFACVE
jgi:hypothetical protein